MPAKRKFSGRICHDGEYMYVELVDPADPAKLKISPQIACYDDWEFFMARQRAQPFRQILIGPTGMVRGLSYGEINWRQRVPDTEHGTKAFGAKVFPNTSGKVWITRVSFPLHGMLDSPVKPGDTVYMNIIRVSNPSLAKEPRYGLDTWVSHTTVQEVDRLGTVKIAAD